MKQKRKYIHDIFGGGSGIQWKVIFLYLVTSVLPIILISVLAFSFYYHEILNEALTLVEENSDSHELLVNERLGNYREKLYEIVTDNHIIKISESINANDSNQSFTGRRQLEAELKNDIYSLNKIRSITLYHWDLPQALQDMGGWANPDMPGYFLEYAKVIFDALGGKVNKWITLNEPYCAAFLGNYEGRQAPGIRDFSTAVLCAYHMYVGHGLVVDYFRNSPLDGEIGIALNLMGRLPYSDSPEDIRAAKIADGYLNRWFLEPLVYGKYPEDMTAYYEAQGVVLPAFRPKHLRSMSQKLDFIGLNYYNDFWVKACEGRWPLGFVIQNPPCLPVNDRGWPVTEKGFQGMLLRLKNEYGIKKIYITENGTSFPDVVSEEGTVEDGARKDYLQRHICAMHAAVMSGVPVKGYFQWSLYDNFEWSFGYASRFGIVFVDFETQKRTVKQSGRWYSEVIKNNGIHGGTKDEGKG